MNNAPLCPKCNSEYSYANGERWVCPECAHEWPAQAEAESENHATDEKISDAHGNILAEGDSVTIIKDLKVKGSSSVIKVGTKIKSIRLIESSNGHNIACKIEGFGAMNIKSEFVKKI